MAVEARQRPTRVAGSVLRPNSTTLASFELATAPAMCTYCDATEQPLPESTAPSRGPRYRCKVQSNIPVAQTVDSRLRGNPRFSAVGFSSCTLRNGVTLCPIFGNVYIEYENVYGLTARGRNHPKTRSLAEMCQHRFP